MIQQQKSNYNSTITIKKLSLNYLLGFFLNKLELYILCLEANKIKLHKVA